MSQNYDYLRVKIQATITTQSPLHCGSGEIEGNLNKICRDNQGKPYIPATTLRGSLRSQYESHVTDPENTLFGGGHDTGVAGKVYIYDAFLTAPAAANIIERTGVAIDKVTQTAKAHQLYTHEIVLEENAFTLNLEINRVNEKQLGEIITSLKMWNNAMLTAIGKGRSKGWGKLQLGEDITIEVLTNTAVKSWVELEPPTPAPQWAVINVVEASPSAVQSTCFNFNIYPSSPLLINDPIQVGRADKGQEGPPGHVFMRNAAGKAIIPGSTLKGAVRAHAHKIMATIAHLHYGVDATQAADKMTPSIEQLFGSEQKRSLFWFSDAIANATEEHPQFFNAVDRFTGGVKEGALFNVIAANCEQLSGTLIYDNHPKRALQEDWWKGLLLLVARDFMEDDFAVGWGKGKGYGRAKLAIEFGNKECKDITSLMTGLTNHPLNDWIAALHTHIESITSQLNEEEK